MADILQTPGVVAPFVIDSAGNRVYIQNAAGQVAVVLQLNATSRGIVIEDTVPTDQILLNWDATVGSELDLTDTNNGTGEWRAIVKGNALDLLMTGLPTVNPGVEVGRLYAASGTIKYVQTAGTRQVESVNVAYTVAGVVAAGNMTVIVTAAGMTGTPRTVTVAVTTNQTEGALAISIMNALNADADVGGSPPFFVAVAPGGVVARIVRNYAAANDGTMNLAIADPNGLGITAVVTSTHTTAGASPT